MNKRYDTLLFDLDGTLIHSKPGIMQCFMHAISCMKKDGYPIDLPDDFDYNTVIGPPLTHSFKRFVDTQEDVMLAVKYYRELYLTTGWKMSDPFEGIPEALERLKKNGKRLLVATSKMEQLAQDTLAYHGIAKYFDVIGGATPDDTRSSKQDVIEWVLSLSGADRKTCVMIGDRLHDMEGAAETGMDAIGVLWGYGPYEELASYHPVFLAQTPADLCDYLL